MTETSAPAAALFSGYRTRGMTDEVTECQRCGKSELRGTVIVEVLDPDGNVVEVEYWGSTCAARYGKVKVSVIKAAVRAAEVAAAEEARAARYWAAFGPWLVERFGVDVPTGATAWPSGAAIQLLHAGRAQGLGRVSPFGAMQMFETETGRDWSQW